MNHNQQYHTHFGSHIQDENQFQQQRHGVPGKNMNTQYRQPIQVTKTIGPTQYHHFGNNRPVLQDMTKKNNTTNYVFGKQGETKKGEFSVFSYGGAQQPQPFAQNGSKTQFTIKNGQFVPSVTQTSLLSQQLTQAPLQSTNKRQSMSMDMDEDSIFDDIDDFDQLEDPIEISEQEPENPPAPVRDPAQECYEYANDIYKHMRTMENRYLPKPNYMRENQQDINASMRGILVDWLNEVCQEYKLKTETLYLAVNIADRTLSHFPIPRNKLQMVGVTSLFISAKYNELSPPNVDDFVFITDNTYPKSEILLMETHILNALEFNITVVTSIDFLVRFLRSVNATETCYSLAFYLTELTLQDYSMIKFVPSTIATAAVIISLHTLKQPCFPDALKLLTGYSGNDMVDCVTEMMRLYQETTTTNLAAVKTKYSRSKQNRVSLIPVPTSSPDI